MKEGFLVEVAKLPPARADVTLEQGGVPAAAREILTVYRKSCWGVCLTRSFHHQHAFYDCHYTVYSSSLYPTLLVLLLTRLRILL